MQIGKISKHSNRNNIFLQLLLLRMPKLEPKQLTRNQQRELDRKRREKREKANLKKSKQRSRLTEDMKELERDKDRVRRSRSRERKSGAPEGKAQLLEEYRAQKEPHYAKIRASKKEAEEACCALMSCVPVVQTAEITAEKKDPVAGYPKLSQVGLPTPLILNYIRLPLPGKVSL